MTTDHRHLTNGLECFMEIKSICFIKFFMELEPFVMIVVVCFQIVIINLNQLNVSVISSSLSSLVIPAQSPLTPLCLLGWNPLDIKIKHPDYKSRQRY